jgi:predicted CoA-binding protein
VDDALKALLSARTIAVVGLDTRKDRVAYRIASYLQGQGYQVIPVPVQQPADEVLGEKAYPSVRAIPGRVDVVDVFVRSEYTDPIIDDAIAAGAGALWLQEGIRNPTGLDRARAAGLVVAQDRCTMVEHREHVRRTGTGR